MEGDLRFAIAVGKEAARLIVSRQHEVLDGAGVPLKICGWRMHGRDARLRLGHDQHVIEG